MGRSVAVCRVSEVPEGRGRVVRLDDWVISVFRDGDRIVAIQDACPHAGASLGSGWVEDGAVVCPLHRWRFSLIDGRCLGGGRPDEGVSCVPVEVREGWVWVSV
ncbi:Rieske (2Fe-2S) protein [Tautonia rosea]|uniref:Rieske (2Fe-2S) protein n=1 Tax=Tautonia rosea TaxID=2728037 RepID=UPI0016001FB0|nr:Rieske 2Fe-2S domain-containing protein [Tautonia rosea]